MELKRASRVRSSLKIFLSGPSGSGKTFSALQVAYGIAGSWEHVCVIDTEQGSASLYSNLGPFNVIELKPPFHPESYIEAIQIAIDAGMKAIVIDSISHEWSGKGGCLELHEKAVQSMKIPNSFTAWATITPLHQKFIDAIVSCPVHVICTARSKAEYLITERDGKKVPQKFGMAPITREGFEYEVSVHLEIDQQHLAHCSKDRTGLFSNKEPFQITSETGVLIKQWSMGTDEMILDTLINRCPTIKDLTELFDAQPDELKLEYRERFRKRKTELLKKMFPNGKDTSPANQEILL